MVSSAGMRLEQGVLKSRSVCKVIAAVLAADEQKQDHDSESKADIKAEILEVHVLESAFAGVHCRRGQAVV